MTKLLIVLLFLSGQALCSETPSLSVKKVESPSLKVTENITVFVEEKRIVKENEAEPGCLEKCLITPAICCADCSCQIGCCCCMAGCPLIGYCCCLTGGHIAVSYFSFIKSCLGLCTEEES